jgi:hypothetical protein
MVAATETARAGKLRSASGQAAAKARRMHLAVSTTRAAIFKTRGRSVANSAVANSLLVGSTIDTLKSSFQKRQGG